jgi:Polyketide cyclase / dehydrase and lipid transport
VRVVVVEERREPLRRSIRIEVERRFAITLRRGFDYITDPARWPEYWPRLLHMDPQSQWRDPGDRARLTLSLLGRAVELEMTLMRIDPYRFVEYTSEQQGLPTVHHERHFIEANGNLAYRVVVEYEPRPGWRGLYDRVLVRRASERAIRETMDNLGERFRALRDGS